MRHTIGLAIAFLLAPVIVGQTTPQPIEDRDFTFQHTGTVQEFQEIATLIRTITEIRDLTADNDLRSLAVHGTAEQVELAGWLVKQLDQPAGAGRSASATEYKGPANDDVVRIFYLPHAATTQDFQEVANAVRTITEIRRAFTYNDGRAMVVRATPEEAAMAEWVARELDQATDTPSSATPEYRIDAKELIRVFHVANAKTVQDFQEMANSMRTMAEIRRVFTYNAGRTTVVRGTPEELGMADWLLRQLDKPGPQMQASEEFRVPGAADDVMRVFYLPPGQTTRAFQQSAAQIRTTLEIRRVFTYNSLRALSVRGTESQLALAQHMIEQLGQ
jgi:hypothetical protein